MQRRAIYPIAGLLIGGIVDVLLNLVAAAIQNRAFADQFSGQWLWWLVGLAVAGLLIGYWLGKDVTIPLPSTNVHRSSTTSGQSVILTRLQALLSYAKLRGQGITLSDILLIGSRIDIDSKD